MIKEITIEGLEKAKGRFDRLTSELLNPKKPLNESGDFMREEAVRNFPAEGKVFGEKWPPLKEITIKIKQKKGYGGQPMMVRTGRLRDSFFVEEPEISEGFGTINVLNPTFYAKFHQMGVGKLPRRVLLKFSKKQREKIAQIFVDWIYDRIEKSFRA